MCPNIIIGIPIELEHYSTLDDIAKDNNSEDIAISLQSALATSNVAGRPLFV